MGKAQLILTCLIDEIDVHAADHIYEMHADGCPVEVIINGRHFHVLISTLISDTRQV